ncbi:MAG: hypothetical protein JWO08_3564 [Verrucomicrobiaceae bacterium]|nr:hypothetical protein [Verrucomicrobiaceae bacterium]
MPLVIGMRLILPLCFATASLHAAPLVDIQVSPEGPIKTFAQARDEVRKQKAAHPDTPIRVQFADGRYPLTEPVVFGPEDSGSRDRGVIYVAGPGAHPVIDGGVPITGWQPAENGLWKAAVPKGMVFEQLWVDGQRATRARTPNVGFLNMHSQAGSDIFAGVKDTTFTAFVIRPDDFKMLHAIPRDERDDVLLQVMHTWATSACRIKDLHENSRSVLIKGRSRYPFVQFEPDQRYYAENFRAALDAPGEWFLDRKAGVVLYKPLEGEDMAKAKVFAPVANQFIVIKGDAKARAHVHDIEFRGLKFNHSNMATPPDGFHDGQAASGIGAAIEIQCASKIDFINCEISGMGEYGIWFKDSCFECAVSKSHLHDLGGGGVKIGTTKMPAADDTTHRIVVDNNIIQHGGLIYPSACGVLLTHASDCEITHNDIGDFYYTGISAGWVWGYAYSPSKRNRIDYNHIHHLGWGVLSDMGGVYLLGRAEGTTVNHNYVHHVSGFRYGGWGLYTDEGSTGVTMENNLVHDTTNAGFHQHYGKWNHITNNIFAFGQLAQVQRSRPEKHASFEFDHNIVYYTEPVLFDGSWYNWEPGTFEMRSNLYWNAAGLPVKFLDADLAGWQKKTGRDEGSVVADPLFADAAKRDFTLKKDSPALTLGFKPFDPAEAGVGGSGAPWRQLATSLKIRDWEANSKPWPLPTFSLKEDFEFLSLGLPALPRAEIQWENKGDKIEVTEEQAASGKRSLKFQDAPGLDRAFDPHLILKPKYKSGTATCSFALRFEPGASFNHEWRDAEKPYGTGPSISVQNGKLSVAHGKPVLNLEPNTWVRFGITAALGDKAGKWSAKATLPDGSVKTFAELPTKPGWGSIDWLGFVSDAKENVAFFIDDLSISQEP